jgi:hypothetical protein
MFWIGVGLGLLMGVVVLFIVLSYVLPNPMGH